MKKIILSLVILLGISYTSAAQCLDLKTGLSRGVESSKVLALQNFLYEKGYLKAKPNGYFGGGTVSAVKIYQKSFNVEQSGNVGPTTRATIKKETCIADQVTQITPTPVLTPVIMSKLEAAIESVVPITSTPSGLRNAKRREDLEKLLKNIYRDANPTGRARTGGRQTTRSASPSAARCSRISPRP